MIFIATSSLRATWLPEGYWKCMYIQPKNKLWNSCFVSFITFLCFSLLSQTQSASLFYLSKIAGVSFVSRTLAVFYGTFLYKLFPWRTLPVQPTFGRLCCKVRGDAATVAPSFLDTRFVLIYLFRSFRSLISTENIHCLQYFCLSLGKVLVNVNIINI